MRPFEKGTVIVNCGHMGLDWERASLSAYIEAVLASRSDGAEEKPDPTKDEGLARFFKAHLEG